ncbi:hypothetical protein HMPREF0880_02398 [Yokenella regensburgei ATCC 43003]|nr:hypothetical protein HMPREF0880_02398 [Yokenella regensburgei ATCC 43003]
MSFHVWNTSTKTGNSKKKALRRRWGYAKRISSGGQRFGLRLVRI